MVVVVIITLFILCACLIVKDDGNVSESYDKESGNKKKVTHHDYESNVEIVTYRGRCIWTLSDIPSFPWCAWVHLKHKEYTTLEEARADIDLEQEKLKKENEEWVAIQIEPDRALRNQKLKAFFSKKGFQIE